MCIYLAAAAVVAAATTAVVVVIAVAVVAASEKNDEDEDYPKAAIAVTITEAHIYEPFLRTKKYYAVFCLRAV